MHFHLSEHAFRAVLAFIMLLVFAVLRRRRRGKVSKRRRFRLAGPGIGNALHVLHAFVDPGVRCLIVEKLNEHADDSEDALTDPAKHFERQLRRIRRGEPIERLTILRKE